MEPIKEQRRFIGKKKHPKLLTDQLQIARRLKEHALNGLIVGTAVWLCVEDLTVSLLDASCFGNLDGGPDMALHVKHRLELCGCTVKGVKAVRLALDEAFFMQHCLNNLKIYGSSSGCDTICHLADSEVWQQFRELRSDFLIQYLAYHHFRSKGWIARTGQQFGADYVLYQRHPAIAHSDYSVIIIPLTSSSDTDLRRPDLDWCDIQILNRMSVQVHKRLLLFYVKEINPGGGDKSSPNCLSNWAVHETLVRRWVAESHRSM